MKEMSIKASVVPLCFAASSLAIIQGVTWFFLSFFAVLIHYESWEVYPSNNTYGESLNKAIIDGYLLGDGFDINVFIKPRHFAIWSILVMITSIFWIILSIYLIIVAKGRKNRTLKKCMLCWSIWTIVICLADLLLMSLLGRDYSNLISAFNSKGNFINSFNVLSCGIIMVIAARGFVLWLINLTLSIILIITFCVTFKRVEQVEDEYASTSVEFLPTRQREMSTGDLLPNIPRLAPVQSTNKELTRRLRSPPSFERSSLPRNLPSRAESSDYFMQYPSHLQRFPRS
ncbi:hypothetical protein FQA39_LY06298 [Lamprigera yunnana]|nr:hypothetical protein FQA39_LY06298 [Lamprigera yunnana]